MQRLDEIQLSAATNLGETLDMNGKKDCLRPMILEEEK